MSEDKNKLSRGLYQHRAELVALAILVPLAVVLGLALRNWPTEGAGLAPTLVPVDVLGEENVKKGVKTVTLAIENEAREVTYEVEVVDEETVQKVLERAVKQPGIDFDMKDYGGSLGVFVEAINGLKGDTARGIYWHLYINGVLSPVGASTAVVGEGDTITWKYEEEHEKN